MKTWGMLSVLGATTACGPSSVTQNYRNPSAIKSAIESTSSNSDQGDSETIGNDVIDGADIKSDSGTGNSIIVVNAIAGQTISEDQVLNLDFTITGARTGPCESIAQGATRNESMLPSSSMSITGTLPNCKLSLVPVSDTYGIVEIGIEPMIGGLFALNTFSLTINPVNDRPTINVNSFSGFKGYTRRTPLTNKIDVIVDEETSAEVLFDVFDADPDDQLTIQCPEAPNYLEVNNASHKMTLSPLHTDIGGPVSFLCNVSDGTASAEIPVEYSITIAAALHPPVLANAVPQVLVATVAMSGLNFANNGAAAVSCAAAPELPAGLSLNVESSTCKISGTPAGPQSATTYTVTATAADGSTDDAMVTIIINSANAPELANASSQALVTTVTMTPLSFVNSGAAVSTCMVAPTLPIGLSMNKSGSTCQISGTPSSSQTSVSYTVTATAADGSTDTANVSITINAANAPNLADASSQTLITTVSMTPLAFINSGAAAAVCTVSPSLPNGLSLAEEASTCKISGTPTSSQTSTPYTVTATAADGSVDTAIVNVTINAATPPVIANAAPQTLTTTLAMNSVSFVNSGATAVSCVISPIIPDGLSLSNTLGSCRISGTPTSSQSAATYSVTATAADGSQDTAEITIAINAASPPVLANAVDKSFVQDRAITSFSFTNSGSPAVSCSISPDLPPGLSISVSASTCLISGTPTATQSALQHTITGTAADGTSTTATVQITVAAASHRIFISSTSNDGQLGNIGGADQICQDRANASSLGGQWKAILSTSLEDASNRIQITSAVYNLKSTPQLIANDSSDLWDGTIANAVRYTESGADAAGQYAITASTSAGAKSNGYCVNWTSNSGTSGSYMMGAANQAGSSWITSYGGSCNQSYRLYCIDRQKLPNMVYDMQLFPSNSTSVAIYWTDTSINETGFEVYRSEDQSIWDIVTTTTAGATNYIDSGLETGQTYYYRMRAINADGASGYNAASAVVPSTVHRMFVSSSSFNGAMGGISGADDSCTSLASEMGGNWKALLSTSTTDAKDHVTISGPIIRVQTSGTPTTIATGVADLWDGSLAYAVLNTESGTPASTDTYVITGSTLSGTKTNTFCTDWTSSSSGGAVTMGKASSYTSDWIGSYGASCNQSYRIYCIEQ